MYTILPDFYNNTIIAKLIVYKVNISIIVVVKKNDMSACK
jgi:hypothetical protein